MPRVSRNSAWSTQEWAGLVATTHRPRIFPARMPSMMPSYDQLGRRGMRSSGMSSSAATSARWAGSVKSRPPSRFVVFEKSREPIALHWPVIELAPVPGRPMLPVIKARLIAA